MSQQPFVNTTLAAFLDQLGSNAPTPGGGAAAALAGALAAALGQKVCQFTLGKPKFAAVEEQVRAIQNRLARSGWMLRAMIDEDAEAYAALSAAFKIPRDDATRQGAIEAAATVAAMVPLQAIAVARRIRADLGKLVEIGNPHLAADAHAGQHAAAACVQMASENVRANLPFVAEGERGPIERELSQLAGSGPGR